VALLTLRPPNGDRVHPAIAERCARVHEVTTPTDTRLARHLAWSLGLLRGLPPWATDCHGRAYASTLEHLLDEWRPDVVEIHFQAMAQYVDAAARRGVPRILVDYDPAAAWALEMVRGTTEPRRLARREVPPSKTTR
jgi:hypothetical protein